MKKVFMAMGLVGLLIFNGVACGQEIFTFGGISNTREVSTYNYAVGFHHSISGNFGGEILYVNNGHTDTENQYSHRDGILILLSYDIRLFNDRLVVRPLIGPYFFCDTQDEGAQIKNSIGGYAGIGANLYLGSDKRFFITTRAGYVLANESPNSFSFLVGAGFHFDPPKKENFRTRDERINEISFGIGQTMLNVKNSPRKNSLALSLQLRRKLFEYVELTGGFISEGERKGILMMPQAVIKISDRLNVGIGIGPYISNEDRAIKLNEAAAITAAYEFNGGIVLRGTFIRILASQANDSSDFFTTSVGYRF